MAGDGTLAGTENTETETHWIAPEAQQLHWEKWGDQYALYDDRSGETHMLVEPAARILQQLVSHAGAGGEVAEALLSEPGEVLDAQSLELCARLLRQLYGAGLIEKAGA